MSPCCALVASVLLPPFAVEVAQYDGAVVERKADHKPLAVISDKIDHRNHPFDR